MSKKASWVKENIVTLLFFGLTLAGCSGGGGSMINSNNSPITTPTTTVTIENISNFAIENYWNINASDPNKLYLGTASAIIEVDKTTGAKRTIVGNTYDSVSHSVSVPSPSLTYPSGLQLINGNVYAGTYAGRVVSAYTDTDQFDAANMYLPYMFDSVNGWNLVTSNSTTLYYGGDGGIYAKGYDSMDAPILLYPTTLFNAVATDDALFAITYTIAIDGNHYYLMKYDLITGQSTTIQSNLTGQPGTGVQVFPMTRSGANIYWLSNCSIYGLDTTSGDTSLLTTMNLCGIYEIIADDSYLYARNWQEIDKVSLATGITTTIPTNEPVWSFVVDAGKIYYATGYSGWQIKMIDETQQITPLLDLQDFGFSTLSEVKLAASDGKLIVTTGEKVFIYDLLSHSMESIMTHTGSVMWIRKGLIYTGEDELVTIPFNKKIRPIKEIFPAFNDPLSQYTIISTAIDTNAFYWIMSGSVNGANTYYRIYKAALDGTNYQKLYEGNGELRDLAVHKGKLYFTCYDQCGDSGWVLASLSETGGTPTPEVGLLGDPLTYYKNGIFYVVDTYDFTDRSLFAINLEILDYKELLSGLNYDNQTTRNVIVDASSKWLYVEQSGGRYRYPLNAWNSIGSSQKIDDGFSAMSTDGKYLYFWGNSGFKRVAE
jgi:hypothetical protein